MDPIIDIQNAGNGVYVTAQLVPEFDDTQVKLLDAGVWCYLDSHNTVVQIKIRLPQITDSADQTLDQLREALHSCVSITVVAEIWRQIDAVVRQASQFKYLVAK
ncbi:MAG: hypothetical protein KDA31_07145 [Phycisphaerales bacterium]|nr:hypothetical protein [Phycisphaerales bacterium]MCB9837093.1 hypothetical protein [Phycisphaera sp.]